MNKNQSEEIQNDIIACTDANLENLVGRKLTQSDIEKLKTDLCQIIADKVT